jgi:hypothetical protein
MPLQLEFKPKPPSVLKSNSSQVEQFPGFIMNLPFLIHQGASVSVTENSRGEVTLIRVTVNGLCVTDKESSNMLVSLINEKLEESDIPFYLSGQSQQSNPGNNEALFLHKRFIPIKSRNSKNLSKIESITVPEEFCCSLSTEIMDEPVFDIRSPHIMYDYNFLMYWINKSHPKDLPHTKLPFDESFLKTNYKLKGLINSYMQTKLAEFDRSKLNNLLIKCKLISSESFDEKLDQGILDQALRRSVVFGDQEDLTLLLSFGANINGQDNNPKKRLTSLHLALLETKSCDESSKEESFVKATRLIYAGAKIDIKDANNRTPLDIIKTFNGIYLQRLLFVCDKMKSYIVSPVSAQPSTSNRHGLGLFSTEQVTSLESSSTHALTSFTGTP